RFRPARGVRGAPFALRRLLGVSLPQPAAAIVSGLPLVTKPLRTRLRLVHDAFSLMAPHAPFIQFTYAVLSPIPKSFNGLSAEPSERIWLNVPPARVWVYRKG